MNHSIGPLQDQHHSASVPDESLIECRPSGSRLLELPDEYNSHIQSNERDIHAFLASELFGPDPSNSGAENDSRTRASLDLTWEQTPGAPESCQAEALTLFRGDTSVEHVGVAGVARSPREEGSGASGLAQVSLESDPSIHSIESLPRKETRKAGNGTKGKKRSAQLQEASPGAIYDQLEKVTTELCELKVQHQQLQSKNLLLEKCLRLEHSQKLRKTSREDIACEDQYIAQETTNSEQGPSVTVSVRGEPHNMTVYEISRLSVADFAALWTVYIQTIGACLVQAGAAKEGPTVELLHRLTFESSQLLGCIMLLNHKVHKAMLHGQMDTKLAKTHSIDKFYKTYVGLLELSKEQLQDFEVLRRIYLIRRAGLAKERKMLMHQAVRSLSHAEDTVPLPGHTRVASLAARLQEIAQEDYRVYHRIAAAARRGVFSTNQWAATIVHAYPYMPDIENVLEAIAKASGNPPKDAVLDDRMMGNMAAEWDALQEYLERITTMDTHAYVPFSVQSAVLSGANLGGQAASRMPFA
ncbi:TPA: hypothetical protein ACH3X2_007923 [Trebouxia sp. C0005]